MAVQLVPFKCERLEDTVLRLAESSMISSGDVRGTINVPGSC